LLRRMQDADDDLKCPHCGSKRAERQFSTFSAGGCGTGSSGKFTWGRWARPVGRL